MAIALVTVLGSSGNRDAACSCFRTLHADLRRSCSRFWVQGDAAILVYYGIFEHTLRHIVVKLTGSTSFAVRELSGLGEYTDWIILPSLGRIEALGAFVKRVPD